MNILPLHAAPQFTQQVIDWIWYAFGEGMPRAFFQSIVEHSLTPGELPLTFIAVEDDQLLGTVGLWRCDLISRQDLHPGWLRCMSMKPPGETGWRENFSSMLSATRDAPGITSFISGLPVATSTNVTAGTTSAMRWNTRIKPSISIAVRSRLPRAIPPSDGALRLG